MALELEESTCGFAGCHDCRCRFGAERWEPRIDQVLAQAEVGSLPPNMAAVDLKKGRKKPVLERDLKLIDNPSCPSVHHVLYTK